MQTSKPASYVNEWGVSLSYNESMTQTLLSLSLRFYESMTHTLMCLWLRLFKCVYDSDLMSLLLRLHEPMIQSLMSLWISLNESMTQNNDSTTHLRVQKHFSNSTDITSVSALQIRNRWNSISVRNSEEKCS